MPDTRILFRADGNSNIGLGHVSRCLALIEMLRKDFECLFIINQPDIKIKEQINSYCSLLTLDLDEDNPLAELKLLTELVKPTDIFVTDGYTFDSNYQQAIKHMVKKLVMMDDTAPFYYYADVIINHGGEQIRDLYQTESGTLLFTGFEYLVLRNVFLLAAKKKREIKTVENAFICMGGADPSGNTEKALAACIKTSFIKNITIVIGSAYKKNAELLACVEKNNEKNIRIYTNASPELMVSLISECSIAICPASTIAMEVCCIKTGLISGVTATNQTSLHRQLVASGCCISVGDFGEASAEDIQIAIAGLQQVDTVQAIVEKQASVIDGCSSERIKQIFVKLANDAIPLRQPR